MNTRKTLQSLFVALILLVPAGMSAHEGHDHVAPPSASASPTVTVSPTPTDTKGAGIRVIPIGLVGVVVIGGAVYLIMRKR